MCVNGVNSISGLNQASNSLKLAYAEQIPQNTEKKQINSIPFRATDMALVSVKTQLTTPEDVNKYNEINSAVGRKYQKLLKQMLKSGVLLNNASDNKTSVLDNLYSIMKTPRAEGLDNKNILESAILTIGYPFSVNQKLGDIPNSYRAKFINAVMNDETLDIKSFKEANEKFENLYSIHMLF